MNRLATLGAFALLSLALFRSRGQLDLVALAMVLAAFGLVLAGLFVDTSPLLARRAGQATLYAILVLQFFLLKYRPDQVLIGHESYSPVIHIGVSLAAILTLLYPLHWLPRWRFPMLLALYIALGGGIIMNYPKPAVDVWHFQQQGVAHLLRGENPYAAEYPNVYGERHDQFYGPGIVKDGKVQSCPYPPLSLLLAIPGYLVGDIRWSLLAAVTGTAVLAVVLARRLGCPPGAPAELAVIAFLYAPAGFLLIELGWTEPYMALAMAATLAAPGALGLAAVVGVKQYGFLFLPALRGHLEWRSVALGCVLAGLIALPFWLWGPGAFWFGLVEFQFLQPFRDDALSVPAAIAARTGWRAPGALGLLTAGLVAALVLWRGPRQRSDVPLAAAAILLALVLFTKQAFLNYYWLVLAFLMLSAVLASGEDQPVAVAGPAE